MYILHGREAMRRSWARGVRFGNAARHTEANALVTGGMIVTQTWDNVSADYNGASSKTLLSGRVLLEIAAEDEGVIAEAGGNGTGWVLYAFNGLLYLQHGNGGGYGDATNRIEISAPIPVGASIIEFSMAGSSEAAGSGKAALYADGSLLVSKTIQNYMSSGVSGSNVGGIGNVHGGTVAANRGGWSSSGVFSGSVTECLIFNAQVTADLSGPV